MQKTDDKSRFPACVTVDDMSYAELALYHARRFFETLPDAPRTVADAMDEFDVQTARSHAWLVGSDKQTTLEAATSQIYDLAIIDSLHSIRADGRGAILFHSADINPDKPDDSNHRLLLVVFSADSQEHYMADVTKGVRVENWNEYNDEVAARLEPNGDGTFSAPAGQVRYVTIARNLNPGARIVYQGKTRRIFDIADMDGTAVALKHNGQTMIEFADGTTITVPADLEITYVDNAG